jgi:hypothetical protein
MRVTPASSTEQLSLDFGDAQSRHERESKTRDPGKAAVVDISDEAKDKARSKAAENAEYADKRVKSSPLIRQAEIERMKEILNKPKVGGGGGGGGGMGTGKMNRDISKLMRTGGKIKSASARADGCCIRGKTRA